MISETNASIAALQQQMADLQQGIQHMYAQQQQQLQFQVRAQLFDLLQRITAPQAPLQDMISAWKSVSFLPLISRDKREVADQAYAELHQLQLDIQQTSAELLQLVDTLSQQVHKHINANKAASTENPSQKANDSMQNLQADASFYSWWDWLKHQFILTKLDATSSHIPDDPQADLKQIIAELQQVNQALLGLKWENIHSLNALLYRLEQRGLDPHISSEQLQRFETTIQSWQQEAKAWTEQL
jgi:allophanate hydrolase subunit 1